MTWDLEPGLVGRTAPNSVQKLLSDHIEQLSEAETGLLGAWEKLKEKKTGAKQSYLLMLKNYSVVKRSQKN